MERYHCLWIVDCCSLDVPWSDGNSFDLSVPEEAHRTQSSMIIYIQVQVGMPKHIPWWWGALHCLMQHCGTRSDAVWNTAVLLWKAPEMTLGEHEGSLMVCDTSQHMTAASHISVVEPIRGNPSISSPTFKDWVSCVKEDFGRIKNTIPPRGCKPAPVKHPAGPANGPLFWVGNH